jgi:hypothetical protein
VANMVTSLSIVTEKDPVILPEEPKEEATFKEEVTFKDERKILNSLEQVSIVKNRTEK